MGGDQKGPSIFLIFKYINKQNVLILNMVIKNVLRLSFRSYEHFKFQNSASQSKIKIIFLIFSMLTSKMR